MLGLDGVDWTLIDGWIQQGRLPNLRRLVNESHRWVLGDANRYLPGAVWADVSTGVSAAVHGYVHEMQLRPGGYEWQGVDASCISVPPFYQTLDAAGVPCAVVDFPIARPLPGFRGVHVIDWGTEFKLWHFEAQPRRFAAQLLANYGRHPFTHYPGTGLNLPSLLHLKRLLLEGIGLKRQLALDLLRRAGHEFLFISFCELHKAGHFFWRFHDRQHPEYTDAEPQLVDALRETYEYLDQALGELLGSMSDNDDLLIIADRGMCANYRGDHLVDEILIALGLATRRGGSATNAARPGRARLPTGRRARKLYKFVGDRLLPRAVREALLPLHRAAIGDLPPFSWPGTRVFRMPAVGDTYLRINLRGREPEGIVSPGAEYDQLLTSVAAQFRALANPETSDPLVSDVVFPAKRFSGPRAAVLPDIGVIWNTQAPIRGAASPEIGVILRSPPPDRTGNHRSEGFALFRGPAFPSSPHPQEADARQVSATILQRFGVALPPHLELPAPWR
jgi:predicted AlkP superfamily phosphohydrolase/phosphomutase